MIGPILLGAIKPIHMLTPLWIDNMPAHGHGRQCVRPKGDPVALNKPNAELPREQGLRAGLDQTNSLLGQALRSNP
jgi:hypothetical protein